MWPRSRRRSPRARRELVRRALGLAFLAAAGAALYGSRAIGNVASSPTAALDSLTELGNLVTGDSVNADRNAAAFLALIGACEGANYNTLFGGGTFDSFDDHPRMPVTVRSRGELLTSTAAGRYQILERTWDEFTAAVGERDFSPAAQDECALWLIRRRGALADVKAGRFDQAVAKCAAEWASLPGAPYGQPVKTLAQARAFYQGAGGVYG